MTRAEYLEPEYAGYEGQTRGWTPLHFAACQGTLPQVVKDLQASGEKLSLADFLHPDQNGITALHEAATHGHLDQIAAVLQGSGEKITLSHLLLKDKVGRPALYKAACAGHLPQIMEILKTSGEVLSAEHFLLRNNDGWTPLRGAARNNHLDQVFTPSYWKGRVGEMIGLWDQVPQENKRHFDFKKVTEEAIQMSVDSCPKMKQDAFAEAQRTAALSPPWQILENARAGLSRA